MFINLDSGIPSNEELQISVVNNNAVTKEDIENGGVPKAAKLDYLLNCITALINNQDSFDVILEDAILYLANDGNDSIYFIFLDYLDKHITVLPRFIDLSIQFCIRCSDDQLFQVTQIFIAYFSKFASIAMSLLEASLRYLYIVKIYYRLFKMFKIAGMERLFSHFRLSISNEFDTAHLFQPIFESDYKEFYQMAISICQTFPNLFAGDWNFIRMILSMLDPIEVLVLFLIIDGNVSWSANKARI
jgi:hypothetical protein